MALSNAKVSLWHNIVRVSRPPTYCECTNEVSLNQVRPFQEIPEPRRNQTPFQSGKMLRFSFFYMDLNVIPPSTEIICPVIFCASGLQRNVASLPISSVVCSLPRGTERLTSWRKISRSSNSA